MIQLFLLASVIFSRVTFFTICMQQIILRRSYHLIMDVIAAGVNGVAVVTDVDHSAQQCKLRTSASRLPSVPRLPTHGVRNTDNVEDNVVP